MDLSYTILHEEIRLKYYRKELKKEDSKPGPAQIILSRTFSSAIHILAVLRDVPFRDLTMGAYLLYKDEPFEELSRMYSSQLELAAVDEENFVFSLHSFYNNVVNMIRKERRFKELFSFMGRIEGVSRGKIGEIRGEVLDAYNSIVLQTLEYIRPNKFDLDICTYGISTEGELLAGPYPYAYSDIPPSKIQRMQFMGEPIPSRAEMLRMYKDVGIEVSSEQDLSVLEQAQRIHCATANALLPYINEYTFDIAPTTPFNCRHIPFDGLFYPTIDTYLLSQQLKASTVHLPANGVMFVPEDPREYLKSIFLKETNSDDETVLLYRIDTTDGPMSGFYNVTTGVYFSMLDNTIVPEAYDNLFILLNVLYASQILSVDNSPDINNIFKIDEIPLKFQVYPQYGKRKITYNTTVQYNLTPEKEKDFLICINSLSKFF